MGAAHAVFFGAVEDRTKAVVLLDAGCGFYNEKPLPGADAVDFAPHLNDAFCSGREAETTAQPAISAEGGRPSALKGGEWSFADIRRPPALNGLLAAKRQGRSHT